MPDSGVYYHLSPKSSGKVVGVAAGSQNEGTPCVQWHADGTDNQTWLLSATADGHFMFIARHSGMAMNIEGASVTQGACAIQWPPSAAADNEEWQLIPLDDGYFNIVSKKSGLLLGIAAGSTADGAQVVQWPSDGTDNQKWQFIDAGVPPMRMMGMVGIKSIYGYYLQAHDDDGELHASNPHRNEEETWWLIEADPSQHTFVLQNWRNKKFLSKRGGGNCAPANSSLLGDPEHWILLRGEPFGVPNAAAFKSSADGSFLRGSRDDTSCGGEVAADYKDPTPPMNKPGWEGWWFIEPATTPTPGGPTWSDLFNAIDDALAYLARAISDGSTAEDPADMGQVDAGMDG